jgi:hypothetical protein
MRKYIAQATYEDFVYPNNNVAVYDNEIVQDINGNEVTGSISGFTSSISGTTLTLSFNYAWSRNNAEVFRTQSDRINLFSVHMMLPDLIYYKPWRLVDLKYITGATPSNSTGSFTTSVTAAQFGVPSFPSGLYSFEIRFIGGLTTYPVCQNFTMSGATPTPTPTSSPGASASPTPTPSVTSSPGSSASPTPTVTPSITPTGSPGASVSPTPTRTVTPSPTGTPGVTPSLSPTPVYYGFPISAGYSTSGLACVDFTQVTTIYGSAGGFLSNSVFYSDTSLTTPYAGGSFYYNNTSTNQYVQIDNSGNNLGGGTC